MGLPGVSTKVPLCQRILMWCINELLPIDGLTRSSFRWKNQLLVGRAVEDVPVAPAVATLVSGSGRPAQENDEEPEPVDG